MSLIQEALKRQQEEMRGKVDPGVPPVQEIEPPKQVPKIQRRMPADASSVAPSSSDDVPVPPLSPQEQPANAQPEEPSGKVDKTSVKKPIIILVATLVLAVAALAVLIYAVISFIKNPQDTNDVSSAQKGQIESTTQQKPPETGLPTTQEPGTHETQKADISAPDIVGVVTKEHLAPPPKIAPKPTTPPPPPVEWPLLTVEGLLGRGNEGSALINKRIVNVGESIEGVRLTGLGAQGVFLEYEGDKKFVKVNSSTQ